jgi:hypothetical protein
MTPEQREKWMASRIKHGGYMHGLETAEHYVWRSMMARCYNPNLSNYKYYGAKGIKVCKKWHNYKNFLADMGQRPSKEHSLDRINSTADYKPSNCKWSTRSEQQKNKTTTRIFTDGKFTGTLAECAEHIKISKALALYRWNAWGSFQKEKQWQLKNRSSKKPSLKS